MDKVSKMSNYYISYNRIKEAILKKTKLKLKYDYCSLDLLEKIQDLTLIRIPEECKKSEQRVKNGFIDYLGLAISDMSSDKVFSFFEKTISITNFIHRRIDIDECKSQIESFNGNIKFDIVLPKRKNNTDLLCAVSAHELAHFSLFLGKDNEDLYEYTEMLSIFFEYMIYRAIEEKNGKEKFLNNRLRLIRENIDDLSVDIMYATNPNYLGIETHNYVFSLASSLTYIESFEYALQLIERRMEDKLIVDDEIGKMLLGEETLEHTAKKLDIDVGSYRKIYSLTK